MKTGSFALSAGKLATAAIALAAATGAAFAAWSSSGPSIFYTMIEAGLAWCL